MHICTEMSGYTSRSRFQPLDKHTYTSIRMKLTYRFALAILLFSSSLITFGQTSPAAEAIGDYVKSKDLNVDRYVEFATAIKADGRFVIDSACIPALLMHFKTTEETRLTDSQWQIVKGIAQTSGLQDFDVLVNYSDAKFMQDCSEKRTR